MRGNIGSGHDIQFLARRDMLDDARNAGHSHFAERIRAVAAIVEDEPLFGTDSVEKVGTKSDGNADNSYKVSRRRIVPDVVGLQFQGAEETHVVRRRHEDELVSVHT